MELSATRVQARATLHWDYVEDPRVSTSRCISCRCIWPRFRFLFKAGLSTSASKLRTTTRRWKGQTTLEVGFSKNDEIVVGLVFTSPRVVKSTFGADDSDATTTSTKRSSDVPPSTTVVLLELGLRYALPSTTVVLLDLGRQTRALGEGGLALRLTGSASWFVGFATPPEALMLVETQTTFYRGRQVGQWAPPRSSCPFSLPSVYFLLRSFGPTQPWLAEAHFGRCRQISADSLTSAVSPLPDNGDCHCQVSRWCRAVAAGLRTRLRWLTTASSWQTLASSAKGFQRGRRLQHRSPWHQGVLC